VRDEKKTARRTRAGASSCKRSRLPARTKNIARLNTELERRVRERTVQLEAANHELEAFSYSVSHDLRAPLRHIDGFIEILQSNAASQLNAENRKYLRIIAEAARQMGVLIDDLLAFARLSRARLNKRVLGLDSLVRDAMRHLKRETEGRQIEWVVHKLPEVRGDPNLLRQALANLISNAVKYSGGRERARIEIGAKVNSTEIVVFVRDNGVGFDMRHADKLFGVFQRLHRANEFEGTGVGLAIVRRIVHRHSGRTWAQGAVNSGATFYFSLPKDGSYEED
jgi:light-regulated signal transduction histidine kinase (bacteriophytochrome)